MTVRTATTRAGATVRKHQLVLYRVRKQTIRARVRTVHRDGTVTVEAQHELRDGAIHGCYLGYRYRMDPADLAQEA